jgi:hypothetical protein
MPKGVYVKRRVAAIDRFARYVVPEPNSGCHLWIGWSDRKGYGYLGLGRRGEGRISTHRFAYAQTHGAIPDGLDVLHKCDVPSCVNDAHLFLGTNAENMADMWAKGRGVHSERIPWAKLTTAAVADIRARVTQGERRCDLASEYGVARSGITHIMQGKTWRR